MFVWTLSLDVAKRVSFNVHCANSSAVSTQEIEGHTRSARRIECCIECTMSPPSAVTGHIPSLLPGRPSDTTDPQTFLLRYCGRRPLTYMF